jgi:hypothetical protein
MHDDAELCMLENEITHRGLQEHKSNVGKKESRLAAAAHDIKRSL